MFLGEGTLHELVQLFLVELGKILMSKEALQERNIRGPGPRDIPLGELLGSRSHGEGSKGLVNIPWKKADLIIGLINHQIVIVRRSNVTV